MIESFFQSPAQNRKDQARLEKASQLLRSQPGFAVCQQLARDHIDALQREAPPEAQSPRSGACAKFVFDCFDITAEALLGLVSDKETANAFIQFLELVEREAWQQFTGVRNEIFPPAALPSHAKELDRRKKHWVTEAYARLATLAGAGAGNNAGVTTTRAARWEAIEILFLSDERVQIRNGDSRETRNYAELGFVDARTGKPNRAWVALRALAQSDGIIHEAAKTGTSWPKVEKALQEIRAKLRTHFKIATNPLPFVHGTGYRAAFKIGCSPSFLT